jgi:putative ATPase
MQIEQILGQARALRPGSPLRRLIESEQQGSATSVILWGPPGTGKTSIANVIAMISARRFEQLSAISAGVKEVRAVIDKARENSTLYQRGTVLFLDEIHRFSKAQQDSLLPAVEAGWITLVAATTENPSFSVISPLLSRSLVVQLEPLPVEALEQLISLALGDARGFDGKVSLAEGVLELVTRLCGGDARRALTILEASAFAVFIRDRRSEFLKVEISDVEASITAAASRYDRAGDQHYDIISAFIKSVRGSDVDAALHYLARMIVGGEDPRFIARRLIILASEDIGLADPDALSICVAAAEAVSLVGMPEGRIVLSEATIYCSLAPKSNAAYSAINKAIEDVQAGIGAVVPAAMRGTGYADAGRYGSGLGYKYPHSQAVALIEQQYAPDDVLGKIYYQPGEAGREREFAALWKKLRSIIRAEN